MTDGWMDDDGGLDGGDSFLSDTLGNPNEMDDGLPIPGIAIPGESDPGADGDDGRDGQAIGGGGQDPDGTDGTDLGGETESGDLAASRDREVARDLADARRVISGSTGEHKRSHDPGSGRSGNLAKSLGEAARGIGRSDNGGDGGATTVSLPDSLKEYVGSTAGRKQLRIKTLAGKAPAPKRRGSQVTGKTDFAGASFEATLNECKFLASGEMRIIFIVPDSESDEAVKLRKAYACSIRVNVERLSHERT